jgi:hypothetical protein
MSRLLWTQKSDIGPKARHGHALAFDSAGQRAVLFGGGTVDRLLADTWTWDGESWTQVADIGPSPRILFAMCYDSARQRVVLFGGRAPSNAGFADTWEWDGDSWTQVSDTGPSARFGHSLAFDAGRSRTVLFGGTGQAAGFVALGDTWEWDGEEWVQREDVGPAARSEYAMTYDAVRGRVVLFGGAAADQTALGDTWEWDGSTWAQKSDFGPAPFARATLSPRGHGRVILFGGNPAPSAPPQEASALSWEWNGKHWALRQDMGPSPRFGHAATFDDARARVVLFGGLLPTGGGGSQILGDTWELFEMGAAAPGPVGGSGLESVSVEPSGLKAGQSGTVTITFGAPSNATRVVTVVWFHPALFGVPNLLAGGSLSVPPGFSVGKLAFSADEIISALLPNGVALPTNVTISARVSGVDRQTTLSLNP